MVSARVSARALCCLLVAVCVVCSVLLVCLCRFLMILCVMVCVVSDLCVSSCDFCVVVLGCVCAGLTLRYARDVTCVDGVRICFFSMSHFACSA